MNEIKDQDREDGELKLRFAENDDVVVIAPDQPEKPASPDDMIKAVEGSKWSQLVKDPNCKEVPIIPFILGRRPFEF